MQYRPSVKKRCKPQSRCNDKDLDGDEILALNTAMQYFPRMDCFLGGKFGKTAECGTVCGEQSSMEVCGSRASSLEGGRGDKVFSWRFRGGCWTDGRSIYDERVITDAVDRSRVF
jgi:hypothetical protein